MTTFSGMRLPAAAAAGIALLALSACGSSDVKQQTKGHIKLTILTHVNKPTQDALAELNAEFSKTYPNISVQVTAADTNNLTQARNTRMQAKDLDITEIAPFKGGETPSYAKGQPPNVWGQLVQAGKFLDLTGKPFIKQYDPAAIKQAGTIGGKVYAVPTGSNLLNGVYYNKKIFADHHLQVPTTWSQLVEVCKKLQQAGVTPFLIGGKEGWTAGPAMYGIQDALYPTEQARRQLDQDLWTGAAHFTDPRNAEVMQKLQTVFSYTQRGFPGIPYDSAPGQFAAGKAAMMPDGSWTAPTITKANPDLDFGYFPMPGSEKAADNDRWSGKYDVGWSVLSTSPHQDAALKWLDFYSQKANYSKFISASGFVPAQPGAKATPFISSLNITPDRYGSSFSFLAYGPANASKLAGFAYTQVAPMGPYKDMNALTKDMQKDWNKATGKG